MGGRVGGGLGGEEVLVGPTEEAFPCCSAHEGEGEESVAADGIVEDVEDAVVFGEPRGGESEIDLQGEPAGGGERMGGLGSEGGEIRRSD